VRVPRSRKNRPAIAIAPIARIGLIPRLSAVRSAVSAGELKNKTTARKATKNAAAFIKDSCLGARVDIFDVIKFEIGCIGMNVIDKYLIYFAKMKFKYRVEAGLVCQRLEIDSLN
jgi:hypothetical protein